MKRRGVSMLAGLWKGGRVMLHEKEGGKRYDSMVAYIHICYPW